MAPSENEFDTPALNKTESVIGLSIFLITCTLLETKCFAFVVIKYLVLSTLNNATQCSQMLYGCSTGLLQSQFPDSPSHPLF